MNQSEIVHHKGGCTTFAGPDAIHLMRAITLRASIRLYAKTGIKSTRAATPSLMLRIAKEYTGKDYKGRDKFDLAMADLDTWIATMRAALPVTDNR
jgi:hypothetical protein